MLMYFQGEPYLNPDFIKMAAYAAKKGIYVATSTNGHYLDEENAKKTVESGISEVLISIDGVSQESYEAYRVGGDLAKVKAGVERLVFWRNELKRNSPVIIIQFLAVRPNEKEIPAIKELGKSLGADKVVIKTAQIADFEKGNILMPEAERLSRYRKLADGTYKIKNTLDNQCWKLWQGAEVTWDGRVLPCCFDKDARFEMGKFPEMSFADIWQSPAYVDFRNRLVKSRKEIDICQNCTEGTRVWA